MYIRCVDCKASTLIQHVTLGAPSRLTCGSCGRHYDVRDTSRLGTTQRDGYENAQGYASDHKIDLPSAYSILLGIMSLEQAHAYRKAEAAKKAAKAAKAPQSRRSARAPDRDVGDATAPTAADAATQETVLEDLASAIGTTPPAMPLPDPIVDAGASSQEAAPEPPVAKVPVGDRIGSVGKTLSRWLEGPTLSPLQRVITTVVLVLLILFVGIYTRKVWRMQALHRMGDAPIQRNISQARPEPVEKPPVVATSSSNAVQIQRNDEAEVVAISGPDPDAVLRAFCSANGAEGELRPLEIAAAVPDEDGTRLGVFLRTSDGSSSTLTIRRDAGADPERWTAGDGDAAIETAPLDTTPTGPPRTPMADGATAQNATEPTADPTTDPVQ